MNPFFCSTATYAAFPHRVAFEITFVRHASSETPIRKVAWKPQKCSSRPREKAQQMFAEAWKRITEVVGRPFGPAVQCAHSTLAR
jgi:hypothetical protein